MIILTRKQFNLEQARKFQNLVDKFRKLGLEDWNNLSDEKLIVYIRANWKCEYCGFDGLPNSENKQINANCLASLEIEHIRPHRNEPNYREDERNFACACKACNHMKEHLSKKIQIPQVDDLSIDRDVRIHLVRTLWILPRTWDWNFESKKMTLLFRD